MLDIPLNLILEKNKISTSSAWLILFKVEFVSTDILYLVNNNEDIVFEGQTYTATALKLAQIKRDGNSTLSSLRVSIVNVDRLMQQKVEEYNGAEGAAVTLTVVNTVYLDPTTGDIDKYAELERQYDVVGCSSDEKWVNFTLGAPNPLQFKLPKDQYSPLYCRFVYKWYKCAYTGAEPSGETTCNLTLADCKLRNNQNRFGAEEGMNSKSYNFSL